MNPAVPRIQEIWVYLSGTPLLALVLTLAAYQAGLWLHDRAGRNPLVNPVAIAVVLVALTIAAIGLPYAKYFEGAQFVHFLLGTATVALAVPIQRAAAGLRGRLPALLLALVCGGVVSVGSAVGIGWLLGAPPELLNAFAAKSITAPIAMGVAERIGASPTLTAVFAVTTGVLGASLASLVLDAVSVRAWWQRGFALGTAAHGIGTSRAFAVDPQAGAYSSLAMGLHGVLGALAIPLLHAWLAR